MRLLRLNCFMVPLVAPQKRRRLAGIAAGIAELNPDVVLLQEVFTPWHKAAFVRSLPQYPYRYLPRAGLLRTGGGLLCFSKLPLLQHSFTYVPAAGHWLGLAAADRMAAKGYMLMSVGGQWPFHLVHAHLDRTYDIADSSATVQRPQLDELTRALRSVPRGEPCVVAGDLNVVPDASALVDFSTANGLKNLTPGGEPTLTTNRYRPRKLFSFIHVAERLDYVLYRGPHVTSSWRHVLSTEPWLSDHHGILVDIQPGV